MSSLGTSLWLLQRGWLLPPWLLQHGQLLQHLSCMACSFFSTSSFSSTHCHQEAASSGLGSYSMATSACLQRDSSPCSFSTVWLQECGWFLHRSASVVCGFSSAWLLQCTISSILGFYNTCWSAAPSDQQLHLLLFRWLLNVVPPARPLTLNDFLALSWEALQRDSTLGTSLWIVYPKGKFLASSARVTSQWLQHLENHTHVISVLSRSGF